VRDIRHIHLAAGVFAGQAVQKAFLFNTFDTICLTLLIQSAWRENLLIY